MKSYLIILSLVISAVAYSKPVTPVDANNFDILGVKFGMTPEEVIKSITKGLGVTKDKLSIIDFGDIVNLITYDKSPHKLTVAFGDSNYTDKKVTPVVVSVRYELPWNQDNLKSMRDRAKNKYGKPSNIDGSMGGLGAYEWCDNPILAWKGGGPACKHLELKSSLILQSTKLSLVDYSNRKKRLKEMKNKNTKPPLF